MLEVWSRKQYTYGHTYPISKPPLGTHPTPQHMHNHHLSPHQARPALSPRPSPRARPPSPPRRSRAPAETQAVGAVLQPKPRQRAPCYSRNPGRRRRARAETQEVGAVRSQNVHFHSRGGKTSEAADVNPKCRMTQMWAAATAQNHITPLQKHEWQVDSTSGVIVMGCGV